MIHIKFTDGRWNTKESFLFHITTKNQIREVVESEDDLIDKLADLPVNDKWAICEPGDGGFVKGEDFVVAMFNNWRSNADKYLDGYSGDKERAKSIVTKGATMAIAVYRNDSAYFERLGGMISFLVFGKFCKKSSTCVNRDKCIGISKCKIITPDDIGYVIDKLKKVANIDQEHSAIIEGLHRWWKANDKRLRSKLWIDGAFKLILKKYKTDVFYRRTINMCLIFIVNNAEHWKDDETFNPNNWFPKKRGKFCNAMFGWRF